MWSHVHIVYNHLPLSLLYMLFRAGVVAVCTMLIALLVFVLAITAIPFTAGEKVPNVPVGTAGFQSQTPRDINGGIG